MGARSFFGYSREEYEAGQDALEDDYERKIRDMAKPLRKMLGARRRSVSEVTGFAKEPRDA